MFLFFNILSTDGSRLLIGRLLAVGLSLLPSTLLLLYDRCSDCFSSIGYLGSLCTYKKRFTTRMFCLKVVEIVFSFEII